MSGRICWTSRRAGLCWGRLPAALWLGSPLALLVGCWLAGLRLNLTGSLPIGLYLVSRAAPSHGALVLICLPPAVAAFAKARGFVPRGGSCPGGVMPVGKRVLATPGDTVTVTIGGLVLNGVSVLNSGALAADRKGRPLPRLRLGRYVVGPGELWVFSSYSPSSFDSRYFGPVPAAQVYASLRRL